MSTQSTQVLKAVTAVPSDAISRLAAAQAAAATTFEMARENVSPSLIRCAYLDLEDALDVFFAQVRS